MSSQYNYDTDAQFFPFFVLTVTSLITFPLTYSLLRTSSEVADKNKVAQIKSSYQPENADIISVQRAKQKRKERRLKRMLTASTGWLVMAYMIYLMAVTARSIQRPWNPYEILDVPWGASTKVVNSRYRRLSIVMHPDKRKPNPALNETIETVNDEWVEVTKAYKSLTDDEIRENWEKYGHPDGKQSTSFGIALPKILVDEGSGKYVLLIYGALLGVGLPMLVGRWWYGSQKRNKEKVLVTSAGNMFREYRERMDMADVLAAVSGGAEFLEILGPRGNAGLEQVQGKVLAAADNIGMRAKDQRRLREIQDPVRRKALALLWAYLGRLDLGDSTLEAEKYELAPTAVQLNEAFTSIALAFGSTSPLLASYELGQCLTQAIRPTTARQPLLQLPHINSEIERSLSQASRSETEHMSLQSLMALPMEQRRAMASAARLPPKRLEVAESVARQLPYLRVEKAFFKVQGEKYIVPSSLVQLVVKARFIPPGTPSVPPVDPKDLLDIDPADGDLKAQKEEPEQHPVPLAHAPLFARDRAPRWHIFLMDSRQGKVAVPPSTFQHFNHAPFDADGHPTYAVVTLKMQFAAPPQPGHYRFTMAMVCDSYLGFDYKCDATLVIEDASKALEVDIDDDISEPEEGTFHPCLPLLFYFSIRTDICHLDSIAGQMAVLKGQPTADPDRPRRRGGKRPVAHEEDESDYESGTDDGDDDEDTSETDTDTDTDEE